MGLISRNHAGQSFLSSFSCLALLTYLALETIWHRRPTMLYRFVLSVVHVMLTCDDTYNYANSIDKDTDITLKNGAVDAYAFQADDIY